MKNKSFAIRSLLWLAAAAVIVFLDRIIKVHILNNCTVGEIFGEIPGVADFLYVRNTGAAFSILNNNTVLLSIISVVFCAAVILYWIIKKPQHVLLRAAVAMLFAGALGNAVDRIKYGFVVDFISIKWFSFPVFNIADISIVIGAVLGVIFILFFDKSEKEQIDG